LEGQQQSALIDSGRSVTQLKDVSTLMKIINKLPS